MSEQLTAYQQSVDTNEESKSCVLAALAYLGVPDSFNDIGCGDGHLVELASLLEIPSFGIDLNCVSRRLQWGQIVKRDLTENMDGFELPKAHLTFSLEVGEHLPEVFADKYCQILSRYTEKILVFSAAIPGQGGSGHINEQIHKYWQVKLFNQGFGIMDEASRNLKEIWSRVAGGAWWYSQNVQVFRK